MDKSKITIKQFVKKQIKMGRYVFERIRQSGSAPSRYYGQFASRVRDNYLYPGIYLEHLLLVVGTIAKHGRAVIVGRGANFILPPDERFSVRVIAPLELRVQNVARWHKVPVEKAKQRVTQRESKRRAFLRQSFNAKITDPQNDDLVINTGRVKIESAAEAVIGVLMAGLESQFERR